MSPGKANVLILQLYGYLEGFYLFNLFTGSISNKFKWVWQPSCIGNEGVKIKLQKGSEPRVET